MARSAFVAVTVIVGSLLSGCASVADYMAEMKPRPLDRPDLNKTPAGTGCRTVHAQRPTTDLISFDNNTGVLYPGALIQWRSLNEESLVPVPETRRAPIELYLDNAVALRSDGPLTAMDNRRALAQVSAANVDGARMSLLQGKLFAPTEWRLKVATVHTSEQALFDLGMKASAFGASLEGSLTRKSDKTRNQYLGQFVQKFYTVAVEADIRQPDGWFTGTSVDYLKRWSDPTTNPIVYIKSVTYGKMVFVSVVSSASEDEVRTALEASADFLVVSGKAKVAITHRKVLEQSDVDIWVYGGGWPERQGKGFTPDVAMKLRDGSKVEQLTAYLQPSGTDDIIWGRPIAYVAKYAGSHDVAGMMLKADYKECDPPADKDVPPLRLSVVCGGQGKDHNSVFYAFIEDSAGNQFAKTGVGLGTKWYPHCTGGPWPMVVTRTITASAIRSGLFLRTCLTPQGDDKLEFAVNLEGWATVPGRPNALPWNASQTMNSIDAKNSSTECLEPPTRLPELAIPN